MGAGVDPHGIGNRAELTDFGIDNIRILADIRVVPEHAFGDPCARTDLVEPPEARVPDIGRRVDVRLVRRQDPFTVRIGEILHAYLALNMSRPLLPEKY